MTKPTASLICLPWTKSLKKELLFFDQVINEIASEFLFQPRDLPKSRTQSKLQVYFPKYKMPIKKVLRDLLYSL